MKRTPTTLLLAGLLCYCLASAQDNRTVRITSLAWQPDGRHILFTAIAVKPDWSDYDEANWRLLRYGLKTGALQRIADGASNGTAAPGGCLVAYEKNVAGNREVFLENTCAGWRENLTAHPAKDGAPAFSPDGKKLAFTSDRNGGLEIFLLNLEKPGAPPTQLTHASPYKSYNPAWRPDGAQLVYYLEAGDHRDQIWLVDSTGHSARNVTRDTLHHFYPAWTPQNRIISTSGSDQIVVFSPDGSGRKTLGITSFFARVSPRKRRIAYIERESGDIVFATYPRLRETRRIDNNSLLEEAYW
ncbi:MAG: PD40 domain-containing protein [Phaeodactylibacter sp.]|nr:PD40 domain-containing protein [Phaeodactylibacter sp.]